MGLTGSEVTPYLAEGPSAAEIGLLTSFSLLQQTKLKNNALILSNMN